MACVQSLGIKPGGPNPGGPAFGNPRICFNVNFNSYAHGLRTGTKVPLPLFDLGPPDPFCTKQGIVLFCLKKVSPFS